MSYYEVELRGSWYGGPYTGGDLYEWHDNFRRRAKARGFLLEYRAFREPVMDGKVPMREGTFHATHLCVEAPNRSQAITRAKNMLVQFVEDWTCTRPYISIDRDHCSAALHLGDLLVGNWKEAV